MTKDVELVLEAKEHLAKEERKKAMACLRKALRTNRYNSDARSLMARLLLDNAEKYIGDGDIDRALKYLKLAVKADPKNLTAQVLLGTLLSRSGSPDEGLEHINVAIMTDIAPAWMARANCFVKKADQAEEIQATHMCVDFLQEALNSIEMAIKLKEDSVPDDYTHLRETIQNRIKEIRETSEPKLLAYTLKNMYLNGKYGPILRITEDKITTLQQVDSKRTDESELADINEVDSAVMEINSLLPTLKEVREMAKKDWRTADKREGFFLKKLMDKLDEFIGRLESLKENMKPYQEDLHAKELGELFSDMQLT